MTSGHALLSTLNQIAVLAAGLPEGAEVSVEWSDAAPDLILAVALQRGGDLRSVSFVDGGETQWAEWWCGGVVVRARQSLGPCRTGQAQLKLVTS